MQPPDDKEMLQELREKMFAADDADEVGYTRYLCELVLEMRPRSWRILFLHARNLIPLGQYDEAARALDRAEEKVPPERLYLIHGIRGHLAKEKGLFTEAESHYLQASALQPGDATWFIYAGIVASASGNVARAEEFARRAVACPEGCIDEAWFNLGGYLLAQKRYPEAKECYHRALEIDPDYTEAWTRLADVNKILRHIYESGESAQKTD